MARAHEIGLKGPSRAVLEVARRAGLQMRAESKPLLGEQLACELTVEEVLGMGINVPHRRPCSWHRAELEADPSSERDLPRTRSEWRPAKAQRWSFERHNGPARYDEVFACALQPRVEMFRKRRGRGVALCAAYSGPCRRDRRKGEAARFAVAGVA